MLQLGHILCLTTNRNNPQALLKTQTKPCGATSQSRQEWVPPWARRAPGTSQALLVCCKSDFFMYVFLIIYFCVNKLFAWNEAVTSEKKVRWFIYVTLFILQYYSCTALPRNQTLRAILTEMCVKPGKYWDSMLKIKMCVISIHHSESSYQLVLYNQCIWSNTIK
jgi:hypothetical protein